MKIKNKMETTNENKSPEQKAKEYMLENWGETGGADGWEHSEGYNSFIAGHKSAQNELLPTLKSLHARLQQLILATPSGAPRNQICDENISVCHLIEELEGAEWTKTIKK